MADQEKLSDEDIAARIKELVKELNVLASRAEKLRVSVVYEISEITEMDDRIKVYHLNARIMRAL